MKIRTKESAASECRFWFSVKKEKQNPLTRYVAIRCRGPNHGLGAHGTAVCT